MKSQVSERLKEPVVPEVLELIFQPQLDHGLALNFAPITLINRAHVVMLGRQGSSHQGWRRRCWPPS